MATKEPSNKRGSYSNTYESLAAVWQTLATHATRDNPWTTGQIANKLAEDKTKIAAKKKKVEDIFTNKGAEAAAALFPQSTLCVEGEDNILGTYVADDALHVVVESPNGDVAWDGQMSAHFLMKPGATPSLGTVDKQLQQMYDLNPYLEPAQLMCLRSAGKTVAGATKFVDYYAMDDQSDREEKRNNQPRRYYLSSALTVEEWRILSDLVAVYPYLSTQQTEKFQSVLRGLCPALRPETRYATKCQSNLFAHMAVLDQAIRTKKQVHIKYGEWVLERQGDQLVCALRQRQNHGAFTFHPYALMWSNGYYYVVGKQKGMMNLRLDRFIDVMIQNSVSFDVDAASFDPATYRDKCPVMYPGKPSRVVLRCKLSLLNTVMDFFGQEAHFSIPDGDGVNVTLNVSPQGVKLFALQYVWGVEVLEPATLRQEVRDTLQAGLDTYNAYQ